MSYRIPKASDKTFIVAKPSENPVKSTGLASKTSSKAETSEKEEVGFFDWFFNSGGSLPDDDDTPPSQRAASYYSSPEASTSADTEMGTDEPEGSRALTLDPEPVSSGLRNPFEALFAGVTPFDMEEEALRSSEEASLYRMERGITDAKGSLGDIITQDIEDRASESAPVIPPESSLRPQARGLMTSPRPQARPDTGTENEESTEVDVFNFDNFYQDIGVHAETDHGSTPVTTLDAREANLPVNERTKDVGFGHKVKASEDESGLIHGIPFKNPDGSYIPLTETQKTSILRADMEENLDGAREDTAAGIGWDTKLSNIGTSWDELDDAYKAALTSLAYNVGPSAGRQWTNVLTAARDENLQSFATGLRRKDSGSYTAGMDNRVVKELYYAGLISNLSDVEDQLPLANARQAGIPE